MARKSTKGRKFGTYGFEHRRNSSLVHRNNQGRKKPHTAETRAKMSATVQRIKHSREPLWRFGKELPIGYTNFDRVVAQMHDLEILLDPMDALTEWLLEDPLRVKLSLVLGGNELYLLFVPWYMDRYPGYLIPKQKKFVGVIRVLCEEILGKP